jgi:thiol-disulfide isomerase/thioredoxin
MIVLHIDPTTENTDSLNEYLNTEKNIFVLFYLEGCGPCNATRPEWEKLENVLSDKYDDNVVIADVDQSLMKEFKNLNIEPNGFPAIYHITNKGKTYTDYEDSDINNKDRTIDSFVEWIEINIKPNKMRGGKWSLKYKRSINCKRPKGFSQKQHCKYGRKKINLFKRKTKKLKSSKKRKTHKRK